MVFLPMFCRVFFFFFFPYLLKSFSLKLITAPFFSVMPAYVVECIYAGRDGVDVIVVMEPFFFLFFPTHTMIEDVASLKLRAEMRRKSTTFFFYFFFFSFSLERHESQVPSCRVNASPPWWSHVVPVDVFHVRRRAAGRTKQSERRNWFPL
jgi:hypothetical protein